MKSLRLLLLSLSLLLSSNIAKSQLLTNLYIDKQFTVHIRGIYDAKIILSALSLKNLNPIEKVGVRNNQIVNFTIPLNAVPGKFKLRIEYREHPQEQFSYVEKLIIINQNDIEYFIRPAYINDTDSSYFKKGEKENTTYAELSNYVKTEREQIDLLEVVLMNYDKQNSTFYKQLIEEYNLRRDNFNIWIAEKQKQYSTLYISHFLQFEYIPEINWEGTYKEKLKTKLTNYFNGINFNDSLLIDLPEFTNMLAQYMGNWGELIESQEDMINFYTKAGEIAIEKASKGDPKVYGWMVDYFFIGYESFNIASGMKMLEKHIQNPNCLTSKKREISRRIEGLKTLKTGTLAPNFEILDDKGKMFNFHKYQTNSPNKLIVFWSADCSHCEAIIKLLYEWHSQSNNTKKVDIIAISLDETDTEINKWKNKKENLKNWYHILADGGVNSQIATDYYILSTPVIFIVDAKTNKIVDMPTSIEEILKIVD